MFENRSLKLPITLGVTMIVLIVVLIVGWILLTVFGAIREAENAPLYWTLLSVGIVVLAVVMLGVIVYLTLSIKSIKLNRRQSNFIDSVTHELKSPIASLKLYLQTMSRHQVAPDEQEKFHQFMLDDVERLDQLIDHLLDAARLERRTETQEVEEIELAELLRQCIEAVCIRYHLDPSVIILKTQPCIVRARRMELEMVFRNLVDNAVKYAGTPPEVVVSMEPVANGRITVQVSDNGRGVPSQERSKIFRRFVRLGSELQRDWPGMGLGLHIVRTLARRLPATVRVRSRDSGGSIFEVQLTGRRAEPSPQLRSEPTPNQPEVA